MRLRSIASFLIAGLLILLFATPADACGCGAFVPREGSASVPQERALIHWDGQTEQIVMELVVEGDVREAAWILPVPTRATVQLGDARLFDDLQELTKPRREWALRFGSMEGMTGGAAPGAGVTVLDQQTLGPFEVTNLAATDAGALQEWLQQNGYQFPAQLEQALNPYVAQGWTYVAVKLAAAQPDQALMGNLDPLWVTFASDQLVYPMRASALARSSLNVILYILADHRVEKAQDFGYENIQFADWIAPNQIAADSPLRPFVKQRIFLTKIQEYIDQPSRIDGDYNFTFAATDTVYREVETEFIDVSQLVLAVLLLLVIGGGGIWLLAALFSRLKRGGATSA